MATSEKTTYTKLKNTQGQVINTEKGQILSIVEEVNYFSFKNTLNGPFYFPSKQDPQGAREIPAGETLTDVTEEEAKAIRKCGAFNDGLIIELAEDLPEDPNYNRNALNESQLKKLFEKHKAKDSDYWREHLEQIDSQAAVERLRRAMGDNGFPNSLIAYCDARLSAIQEEYEKSMREPDQAPPEGI